MKIKYTLSLLLLSAVSLTAQIKEYDICGTVCDAATGAPLSGVYVSTGSKGAQSDNKGKFLIENVPAGDVRLTAMYYSTYPKSEKIMTLSRDTCVAFYMEEDIMNLDEVVVTGTRTEKRLSEAPILTTVINHNDIRKAATVSTMEALQDNIPGLVVTPNAMGNNMRIKGLNSRYILFLVDGERMVSEGAGGNINFDQIDVSSIERIEMINGASSAMYGSNAVGAVVNIITKKPEHKVEAGAYASVQSHNTLQLSARAGTNLKKFSSSVSLFRNSSDGYDIEGGASASKYEDMGANLSLAYRPTERLSLKATGRYFRHETFNYAGSMNTTHPLTHNVSVGVSATHDTSDGKNSATLSVNYDKYLDYTVLEQKDENEKENTSSYLSARFTDTYRFSEKLEMVGGLEYNHEEIFATTTLGSEPTTESMDDVNIFAQADYEAFKNFDIVAGARYTYNNQFSSAFTPKISFMYAFSDFKVRAGVGTAYRAPSIKELYYDFDHQGMFWIYGNPDLKAEKGLYLSASVEYTKGLFNASVSVYNNEIDDKITQYDVINGTQAEKHYMNVSSATLRGVDVNVAYTLFRQLTLKGTYSYCDAVDNATGLQLESNVKHSATLSATWNARVAGSPFSLCVSGRMNSPILYQSVTTDDSGEETVDYSESKAYNIWKISLVKPIRLKKHTLEITAKCDNVFDFRESSFVNPGRQWMAGVRYSFR